MGSKSSIQLPRGDGERNNCRAEKKSDYGMNELEDHSISTFAGEETHYFWEEAI